MPAIFTLGRKRLVGLQALAPIRLVERQAREFLRGWAFHFPIAGARFVPKGSLGTVVDRFDVLEKEFHEEVRKFLFDYDRHKEAILQEYPEHKEALLPYFPLPQDLMKMFSFSYTIYAVEVPEDANLKPEQRNALKERMSKFADDVVGELRKQTQVLFTKVAAKLAKGEIVKQDTFKKVREFVQRFELLNFLDDREVLGMLQRIRRMADQVGGDALDPVLMPDLQIAMATAVEELLKKAGDLSDLDAVTGDYKRRILVEA